MRVVHAFTGADVRARWNLGTGEVVQGPLPPGVEPAPDAQERAAQAAAEAKERWRAGFVDAGAAQQVGWFTLRGELPPIALELPPGLVRLDPKHPLFVRRVANVQSLEVVVPVAPEAPLEVQINGPDGRPAVGATLEDVRLHGASWPVTLEDVGPGVVRALGLPHLGGEMIELEVSWPGPPDRPPAYVEVDEVEELTPDPVEARMPASLFPAWVVQVHLAGPCPTWLCCSECNDCCSASTSGGPHEHALDDPSRLSTLRVRLEDWRGRALRAVMTARGDVTDEAGVFVRDEVRPGPQSVRARVAGYLPFVSEIDVPAGSTIETRLREPRGGRLTVEVMDGEGRPCPAACVVLPGTWWFDVDEDGLQRLDGWTDHHGRRSLARVAPGPTEVHAIWRGRKGKAQVVVEEAEECHVRVVVPSS